MFYPHVLCSPSLQLWHSSTVIISSYTCNCSLWYWWALLVPSLSLWLNGWWSAADETQIMTVSNAWSQRKCGSRRASCVPYFSKLSCSFLDPKDWCGMSSFVEFCITHLFVFLTIDPCSENTTWTDSLSSGGQLLYCFLFAVLQLKYRKPLKFLFVLWQLHFNFLKGGAGWVYHSKL